jgi:hypothetical protein
MHAVAARRRHVHLSGKTENSLKTHSGIADSREETSGTSGAEAGLSSEKKLSYERSEQQRG